MSDKDVKLVVIKRYINRKLYNTESKDYITIEELMDLSKNKNKHYKVVCNKTSKDLTHLIYLKGLVMMEERRLMNEK